MPGPLGPALLVALQLPGQEAPARLVIFHVTGLEPGCLSGSDKHLSAVLFRQFNYWRSVSRLDSNGKLQGHHVWWESTKSQQAAREEGTASDGTPRVV